MPDRDIFTDLRLMELVGHRIKKFTGNGLVDQLLTLVEYRSNESFDSIREQCLAENKTEGRYSNALREKIAKVRRVIEGMDSYEQVRNARLTYTGCVIDRSTGLNIPYEAKCALKDMLWKYMEIDVEKDKDSLGRSLWKGFYEGMFWAHYKH